MPIFCPRSQFLAGSSRHASRARAIFFSRTSGTDHLALIMHVLDSWLHGASVACRVGYRCNPIFQVSNPTISCILKRSARLYGDCMEPDHMVKYSLPMVTDLTKILYKKNTNFLCANPLRPYSSEGVFGRVSALCVHPCDFFLEKATIDETIGGGVLLESNLAYYTLQP
jgi:hypothetical protein